MNIMVVVIIAKAEMDLYNNANGTKEKQPCQGYDCFALHRRDCQEGRGTGEAIAWLVIIDESQN